MNEPFGQTVDRIVKHLRRGTDTSPHVLLGPLVWEGKPDDREWYFLMGSGDSNGFRLDASNSRPIKCWPNKPEPPCTSRCSKHTAS
jgi:hypothetical protein